MWLLTKPLLIVQLYNIIVFNGPLNINIICNIFFFITSICIGVTHTAYTYIIFILFYHTFTSIILFSQVFLCLFIFKFFKSIGLKKTVFAHSYLITLFMYIRECYFLNSLHYLSFFIILCSVLTFIVIFNNFPKAKNGVFSLSSVLYNIHNVIMFIIYMPKSYLSLAMFSIFITRCIKLGLINVLILTNDNILLYCFHTFSLIIPTIYLFRIIFSVILNSHTSVNGRDICILTINELFNIRNYKFNNINFNTISYLCIFFFFGVFILDIVPCYISNGLTYQYPNNMVYIVLSAHEDNVNTNNSPDSPCFNNSPFEFKSSPVSAHRFGPKFEQSLWYSRHDSLGHAKALDLGKRILLNKICLERNISAELQLRIQDFIWGNHWYELYQRAYDHDENGRIVRIPNYIYRDSNGITYDCIGNLIYKDGAWVPKDKW